MTIRVGINGFGRIGRQFLKASLAGGYSDLFEIVSINDIDPAKSSAHLLKYDSTYGKFPGEVTDVGDDGFTVNGQKIAYHSEREPATLPWEKEGVDVVIESTGLFTDAD